MSDLGSVMEVKQAAVMLLPNDARNRTLPLIPAPKTMAIVLFKNCLTLRLKPVFGVYVRLYGTWWMRPFKVAYKAMFCLCLLIILPSYGQLMQYLQIIDWCYLAIGINTNLFNFNILPFSISYILQVKQLIRAISVRKMWVRIPPWLVSRFLFGRCSNKEQNCDRMPNYFDLRHVDNPEAESEGQIAY